MRASDSSVPAAASDSRSIPVKMKPGWMLFTRIWSGAYSIASFLLIARTAPFAAW